MEDDAGNGESVASMLGDLLSVTAPHTPTAATPPQAAGTPASARSSARMKLQISEGEHVAEHLAEMLVLKESELEDARAQNVELQSLLEEAHLRLSISSRFSPSKQGPSTPGLRGSAERPFSRSSDRSSPSRPFSFSIERDAEVDAALAEIASRSQNMGELQQKICMLEKEVERLSARETQLSDANDELHHRLEEGLGMHVDGSASGAHSVASELQQALEAERMQGLKLQAIIYEMHDTHEQMDQERAVANQLRERLAAVQEQNTALASVLGSKNEELEAAKMLLKTDYIKAAPSRDHNQRSVKSQHKVRFSEVEAAGSGEGTRPATHVNWLSQEAATPTPTLCRALPQTPDQGDTIRPSAVNAEEEALLEVELQRLKKIQRGKALARKMMDRWGHTRLARLFGNWKSASEARPRISSWLFDVAVMRCSGILAQAFDDWRDYMHFKQVTGANVAAKIAFRRNRSILLHAWRMWDASCEDTQIHAEHAKMHAEVAVKAQRSETLEHKVVALEKEVQRLSALDIQHEFSRLRDEGRQSEASQQRVKIAHMARYKQRWCRARLLRYFGLWKAASHVSQFDKHWEQARVRAVRTLHTRILYRQMLNGFSEWRHHVDINRTIDNLSVVAGSKLKRLALLRAWALWSDDTLEAKEMQRHRSWLTDRAARKRMGTLLASGVSCWYCLVAESKRLARAAEKVVKRWQSLARARAFSTWLEQAADRRILGAAATRVMRRWKHLCMGVPFCTWVEQVKTQARQKEVMGTMIARMRSGLASKAFCKWKHNASNMLWQRKTTAKVVSRLRRACSSKAFATYAQQVAGRRRRRHAVAAIKFRSRQLHIVGAFKGWVHACAVKQRLAHLSRQICCKWLKRVRTAALTEWRCTAQINGKVSHRAKCLIIKCLHGTVRAGYARWQTACAQAKLRRVASVRILWKQLASCLRHCWRIWLDTSRTARSHAAIATSISFKWRRGALRHHWNGWCEYSSSIWLER